MKPNKLHSLPDLCWLITIKREVICVVFLSPLVSGPQIRIPFRVSAQSNELLIASVLRLLVLEAQDHPIVFNADMLVSC